MTSDVPLRHSTLIPKEPREDEEIYLLNIIKEEKNKWIQISSLPVFLCYHLKNNPSFLSNLLDIFFENLFTQTFSVYEKQKSISKTISECLNEIDGKHNHFVIFKFLENFKEQNSVWIHSILFKNTLNLGLIEEYIKSNESRLNLDSGYAKIPLHLVCENENINFETVKFLVDNKSNLNKADIKIFSPLHFACKNENATDEIIRYLIENKSDVRKMDNKHSLLHLACSNETVNFEIIKTLIESNSSLNFRKNGNTPLHSLSSNTNISKNFFKYLIEKKGDLYIKNYSNETPLDLASKNESISDLINK